MPAAERWSSWPPTPGRPLYERLGFAVQTWYLTMEAPGLAVGALDGPPATAARPRPFHRGRPRRDGRARPGGDRRGPPPPAARPSRRPTTTRVVSATGDDGTARGFVIRAPWGGGATIAPRPGRCAGRCSTRRRDAYPARPAGPLPASSSRTPPGCERLAADGWTRGLAGAAAQPRGRRSTGGRPASGASSTTPWADASGPADHRPDAWDGGRTHRQWHRAGMWSTLARARRLLGRPTRRPIRCSTAVPSATPDPAPAEPEVVVSLARTRRRSPRASPCRPLLGPGRPGRTRRPASRPPWPAAVDRARCGRSTRGRAPTGRRVHARSLAGPPDRGRTRHRRPPSAEPSGPTAHGVRRMIAVSCLQCGTPAVRDDATFCRRCGLPYGDAPRADAELPQCPICYLTVDDDGRTGSLDLPGLRVDLRHHMAEHDRHPVGDDDWLETLREGDKLRWGRWTRPVRDRPPLPGDRAGRRRPQPSARPRHDRHRDDPDPPLGPDAGRSSATSPSGRPPGPRSPS